MEGAFGNDIDYAMLIKLYGGDSGKADKSAEARQSGRVHGDARPFTRLTNGFSKKVENHKASVALYFMFYNCASLDFHGAGKD